VHLFREGRAVTTTLLWTINFLNLLTLYFLVGMLPTFLTQRAGLDSATASLVATPLQVGGVIGTFGLAWWIGQKRFVPVLTVAFLVACISIITIGTETVLTTVPLLIGVVFLAGWCIIGGQPGLNSMAASYYPISMRSTGVGFCLGVGRLGAIVGPAMYGWLMVQDLANESIFLLAGAIALATAVIMFSLGWTMRLESGRGD
jgi:AAHS family 4-hydroxybenzoate transporter-like MFS transporter